MGNSWLCQDTVNNLIQSGQLNELIIIGNFIYLIFFMLLILILNF